MRTTAALFQQRSLAAILSLGRDGRFDTASKPCTDPARPPARAATDFTSVFITWVTGHVTETLPDIPYTLTSVYNVNPLNKSAPGAVSTHCRNLVLV